MGIKYMKQEVFGLVASSKWLVGAIYIVSFAFSVFPLATSY